jgi:hypothetical protein
MQFAPEHPLERDPIELAADEEYGRYAVSKLGGSNGFRLDADRVIRKLTAGDLSVYADGRFEFVSTRIERRPLPPAAELLLEPALVYSHLVHSHWCARELYERADYEGPVFLDWTLWPRAGVEIVRDDYEAPPGGEPIGQAIKLEAAANEPLTAIAAICRLAGRSTAPDEWHKLLKSG